MKNIGCKMHGGVRDVELAGCSGVDCRQVGNEEFWSAGVVCVKCVVGED